MAEALPISGTIDPKAFPFLLMDLHHQAATGSLKVQGPSYQKALYFRGGRILFGSSNDPRDQLGAILIEEAKITPEQLEDVNAKVGPGNPLAKVLAETGFVSNRELSEAARAKVERILSDVIAYAAGAFEFEDGVLPKGAVDLKLSTERLTMAAVRRIADRGFVLRHLDGLGVVLVPTEKMAERLAEVQTETAGLTPHLDGQRTLKDAAAAARIDEFDAAKIACGLVFLGLARPVPAKAMVEPAMFIGGDLGVELDLGAEAAAALGGVVAPRRPDVAPPPADVDPIERTLVDEPAMVFPMEEPPPLLMEPEPTTPALAVEAASPEASPEPAFFIPATSEEPEAAVLSPEAFAPPPVSPPPPAPAPEPAIEHAPTLATSGAPRSVPLIQPPPRASRPRPDEPPSPSMPSAARPSKADLAALDELLNPKSGESAGLSPEKSAAARDAWSPQFARPSRRRAESDVRRPLAIAAAVVVLLGLAGAGWVFWRRPPTSEGVAASTGASPTSGLAPSPPVAGSPPPGEPLTEAVTTTPPPAEAPAAVVSARPPTVAATPPPTAAPAATRPAPATGAVSLADARRLLRQGSFDEAARGFARSVKSSGAGTASVQLLIACSTDTLQKAVDNVPQDDLYILPVSFKGRECYRMLWGLYPTSAAASAAVASLPEYFRKGGASPKVMAATDLVP